VWRLETFPDREESSSGNRFTDPDETNACGGLIEARIGLGFGVIR
jgi:hypothetical protein